MSTPQSLLQIPSVTACQLIGTERVFLSSGTLTLLPPATETSKLLLTVGATLAIPLSTSSTAATNPANPNTYLFTYALDPSGTAAVELTLPESVDETLALKLERLLVQHGFLTTGLVADADDFAGALRDGASRAAETVKEYAQRRVDRREPVESWEERHYSDNTKRAVDGTVEVTGKAAEVTGKVGVAVSGAAESVGEWVGAMMPNTEGEADGIAKESANGAAEGLAVVGSEVAGSTALVSSAVGKGASTIAEHEHGPEARAMVDSGREVSGNVGKVGAGIIAGTSVVWNAGEAGVAAARSGEKK